jgi:hypothetical protein
MDLELRIGAEARTRIQYLFEGTENVQVPAWKIIRIYRKLYRHFSMIAVRQLHRHQFSVILDRFPSLRFTEKEALKGLSQEIFVLMAVLYSASISRQK